MKSILWILFLTHSFWGSTQNLVRNPSFEEYLECPNALGTFGQHVTYWSVPTAGSTDYFNTCSKVMSAPENFNGVQYPKEGKAYAGFYFFAPGDYREYIQAQLTRTLREGQKYILEFYVSLAEGSDFAVKDFGVALSYKQLNIDTKKELSKGRLFRTKANRFQVLEINHTHFHEDKSVWLKITTSFVAKGFEKYLLLGNLRDNKTTRKVQTKRKESKKGAYYYIDKVSLIAEGNPRMEASEMETDSLVTFKNVHFEFDHFNLTQKAIEELSTIKELLEDNNDLHIEIHGHTDNEGSDSYNNTLSKKRAKTIANYFLKTGILPNRISWFGHGSKKPRAQNDTEQGRASNRRAEFLLKFKN